MTILFQALTAENELKNISLHSSWLKSRKNAADLALIVEMMSGHPAEDFIPGLEMLIQLYRTNRAIAVPLMVETLLLFDNELSELTGDRQRRQVNRGPMNGNACQRQEKAYLYLSPDNALQGPFLAANKLRRGGKRLLPHPSGLHGKLENFTVLPRNKLSGLVPEISAYYFSEAAQEHLREGPVRIAVFPFGGSRWFDWPHADNGREFDIAFTPEQDDAAAEACICALKLAEQRQADLVIFPEMAFSPKAKEQVQAYLRANALKTRHIKLIFAGTTWINRENTAYILNVSGRTLLTQKKREPVDFYDKETQISLRERLKDSPGRLRLLDAAGLGRIVYAVCRDFIAAENALIWGGHLEAGFAAASCYTPELNPFFNTAESMAKQYGTVSLVCNACASPRERAGLCADTDVGFLTVPACGQDRRLTCQTTVYRPLGDSCEKGECPLCGCAYFYTITRRPEEADALSVSLDPQGL